MSDERNVSKDDSADTPLRSDKEIEVRRVCQQHKLVELVSAITPANRHGETDWGASIGKELF